MTKIQSQSLTTPNWVILGDLESSYRNKVIAKEWSEKTQRLMRYRTSAISLMGKSCTRGAKRMLEWYMEVKMPGLGNYNGSRVELGPFFR
eukprot:26929-Pelagomonas_calceolata.AAC.1